MNKTSAVLIAVAAAGLAGCAAHVESSNLQTVRLDDDTSLAIVVDGAPTVPAPVASVLPGPKPGDAIHRFLKSSDGKVLFAYDLRIDRSGADGSYNVVLKPAAGGPTFAATRTVAIPPPPGTVQVELMEQPGTGRKVEDGFRIFRGQSFHSRLLAIHNQFYHWVHGD
jgi:hypothetical protein